MKDVFNTTETKSRWYYVPPYRNEGHIVLNEKGEQVANFEDKDEAELAVELFNQHAKNLQHHGN